MNSRQRGLVSTIYGAYYGVRLEADLQTELRAQLRGRLRQKERHTNDSRIRHPAMVGDHVDCTLALHDESQAQIEEVLPRRNALCRAAGHTSHALGANLDLAVVVAGLTLPETPTRFVDRFLVSCHAGAVPPVIVWSKVDLAGDSPTTDEIVSMYAVLGYEVFALDLVHGEPAEAFAALARRLAQGTTLLAGNSGTGKSTLLNRILGREVQRTGEVSHASLKGRHTTTNPRLLLPFEGEARYIDTPGVKEWGVLHLSRREIFDGFPELSHASTECRFPGCEHRADDTSCAVQDLIRRSRDPEAPDGLPHPDRIESLHAMLESLDRPDRIRYGDYVKPTGRMRNR